MILWSDPCQNQAKALCCPSNQLVCHLWLPPAQLFLYVCTSLQLSQEEGSCLKNFLCAFRGAVVTGCGQADSGEEIYWGDGAIKLCYCLWRRCACRETVALAASLRSSVQIKVAEFVNFLCSFPDIFHTPYKETHVQGQL